MRCEVAPCEKASALIIIPDETETPRARLRQFTLRDLDALARIYAKPRVIRYLGANGEPVSREETEIIISSMLRHWERRGFGRWAVEHKKSGRLIGCAGLRSHEEIAELVYTLDEPYWGKGLATEIARECLRYGFERHRFPEIVAFTRIENFASRRVMEKLGMQCKGATRVYGIDVVEYRLRRDEQLRAFQF